MREKKIVEYLLNESEAIPANKLANHLGVSERTLKNDVDLINHLNQRNGFKIQRKRGKGYFLFINNEERFQYYLAKLNESNKINILNIENRLLSIEILLMLQDDFLTISTLADYIEVSESTVKKDLKILEHNLKMYQLELYKKPHYGIKIIGSEEKRRTRLMQIMKANQDQLLHTDAYKVFLTNFDQTDLQTFLANLLRQNKVRVNDLIFQNIIFHIMLLTFRIMQCNYMDYEQIFLYSERDLFWSLGKDVIEYLSKKYQINFPQEEIDYLAYHLKGKIALMDDLADKKIVLGKIKKILKKIDHQYFTEFHRDQELINSLFLHILPLIQRLYRGQQLDNPLIDDLYTRYANVFNVAFDFIRCLNDIDDFTRTISKDEVGFLAVYFAASLEKQSLKNIDKYKHIAVICTTGGGAAYLLKVRLEKIFHQAKIDSLSFHELDKIVNDYDLVISTVPLDKTTISIPIIYINEYFSDQEIVKIEQEIRMIDGKTQSTMDERIIKLFDPSIFWIKSNTKTYKEYIVEACFYLEHNQYADKGMSQSVLEREKLISTIYQNGVAGPHPMESKAIQECIAVLIFKPTLIREKVKISFILNIKSEHLYLHQEISRLMMVMMEDGELEQKIKSIESFSDFKKYMEELIKKGR